MIAAVVLGTVVLAALFYAASCWWFPFARCRWCSGTGRWARSDGQVFRDCWWCGGLGRRWRIGRRVWNFFHQGSA